LISSWGAAFAPVKFMDRIRALMKKAPPQKVSLVINEVILEVVALIRRELEKNGISAQTQLAESLPAIQGDRVRLQQVILNLLINAIEAMSGMSEGPRELLISTAKSDSGVVVSVRDSGPGLTPESRERLFESFYTTKPGGLGMGLSICRSFPALQLGHNACGVFSPSAASEKRQKGHPAKLGQLYWKGFETTHASKRAATFACLPRTGFSKPTVRGKLARVELGRPTGLRGIAGVFQARGALIGN
jgi:hypothetical protein